MLRVRRLAGPDILAFAPTTATPAAWWGAVTANETGEWLISNTDVPRRPERRVYDGLEALFTGATDHFGNWTIEDLNKAMALGGGQTISQLSSSWGLTQVMGYEAAELGHPVSDLSDPSKHYQVAGLLLARDAEHFGLDSRVDFGAMFECWNCGHPGCKTYDPNYVSNGLTRLQIWIELDSLAISHTEET